MKDDQGETDSSSVSKFFSLDRFKKKTKKSHNVSKKSLILPEIKIHKVEILTKKPEMIFKNKL